MEDQSGKKKQENEHLPPWKQPMTVRPEILAAFQKWKNNPDSVYEEDKLRKPRAKAAKMTYGTQPAVEFIIPRMIIRRSSTTTEQKYWGAGNRKKSTEPLLVKGSLSLSSVKATNADPQSAAALGLEHFQSMTSYGFTTLSSRPHSGRKESLFHDESKPKCRKSRKSVKADKLLLDESDGENVTDRSAIPLSPVSVLVPKSFFAHVSDVLKHGNIPIG